MSVYGSIREFEYGRRDKLHVLNLDQRDGGVVVAVCAYILKTNRNILTIEEKVDIKYIPPVV
jgi:hypothetical protein